MSKSLYTPGPWFADGIFIETEGGITGRHIATVTRASTESIANAVVLAAAPELIAALRAVLVAQKAVSASAHDIAARSQYDHAETVAVALLARLDSTVNAEPGSESLSGSV